MEPGTWFAFSSKETFFKLAATLIIIGEEKQDDDLGHWSLTTFAAQQQMMNVFTRALISGTLKGYNWVNIEIR